MKIFLKKTMAAAGLVLLVISSSSASAIGELSFSIGGVYPQGSYAQYADPGVNINGKGIFHIPSMELISGWIDLNFSEFSSEETDIIVQVGNLADLLATQTISETAFSMHGGLQLGSDSRRGFFRPRAAIGPGFYVFSTTSSARFDDADEDFYSESETQTKIGWRGALGVDLFFRTKWGISLDFLYDHVVDLNHTLEFDQQSGALTKTGQAARFHSFMIGVVIPFSTFDSH